MAGIDSVTDKKKYLGGLWKTGAQVDEELGKVEKGSQGGKGKLIEAIKDNSHIGAKLPSAAV